MPIPLILICVTLCAASAALAVYWSIVTFHIARTVRRVPTCRDALKLDRAAVLTKKSAPRVCIIVPAHNEAGVIGNLTASLLAQTYPNLTAVFALDRCTDPTAAEIRHASGGCDHFELIDIASCPPDWAGKVHAIHLAVTTSKLAQGAEILLFTDADTVFHPDCVRAAVALLLDRNLGMLSLMSTLTADRWFEKIAQPAAGIELMRQYPLLRAGSPHRRRAFANGQFLMFTRAAYTAVGTHEAVKDAVLEDIDLARLAHRCAIPAGLFLADGMLTCRMYATPEEFTRGWKRIYIEAANRRVKRLRQSALRVLTLGVLLPACAILAVAAGLLIGPRDPLAATALILGASGLAAMLLALGWAYRLSHVPLWCTILYPIGAAQVAHILHTAARDLQNKVPIRWAGREYLREPR